jgi:hypothetical protein
MARQATSPIQFNRTMREDSAVMISSGRAGVVVPIGYLPLLPADSAAGRAHFHVELAEMPKPLRNAVTANFQAWFIPKSAHPQFAGMDELIASQTGNVIKALGQPDRNPPPYYNVLTGTLRDAAMNSPFARAIGLHVPPGTPLHTDLIDAFNLVYNFRLAAFSSRLARRQYATENLAASTSLPPAFWPSSRFASVVPSYEKELVLGSLDLDVIAGRLPVSGLGVPPVGLGGVDGATYRETTKDLVVYSHSRNTTSTTNAIRMRLTPDGFPDVWAEMSGQTMGVTLADIDKARTTQAFAKMAAAYNGNDTTGFNNDDAIISMLLQGLIVEQDNFKRPWLLDSKRVAVNFAERFASDAANLDASLTRGMAEAVLSINVPRQEVGGVIIFTVEVLPERIDERMTDEWLIAQKPDDLPNALRDSQRVEPVDLVLNRRLDARHSSPNGLYGYEPMNDKWRRKFTRLGGKFYKPTAGGGFVENRANIWQVEILNPNFDQTHFLCPSPFPHSVFSDQNADAFEVYGRHAVTITGNTQFGDLLMEDNGDFETVTQEGVIE